MKRVSASFADDGQESTATATESGVELATLGGQKKERSSDVQEYVVGWQQKVFCQVCYINCQFDLWHKKFDASY